MSYTVYIKNNEVLTTLDIGEVDSVSTSLDLVGKNVNNYGEFINNNFVRLLTNFAGDSSPQSEQVGQLWFDTVSKQLKVYDGTEFNPMVGATVNGTQPLTTSTGDLWYDTTNQQLKVWYNNKFNVVGPMISPNLGSFGIEPSPFIIRDTEGTVRTPGVLSAYGDHFGFVSTSSWTMDTSTATYYLGVSTTYPVRRGLTVFNDLEVRGTIFNNGVSIRNYPKTELSASTDISKYGSVETTDVNTNKQRYENGNNYISLLLNKLYPASDFSNFPTNSEAKVICTFEQFTTATTVTNTINPGESTIGLFSIENISNGDYVFGSSLIPNGTYVTSVNVDSVNISNPVIDIINTGTFISFNTENTVVRHFRLEHVDVDTRQWFPRELYTKSILNTQGTLVTNNVSQSTITVNGTQTNFVSGLQIEFIGGTSQTTGNTIISNVVVNLVNTTTNLVVSTETLGTNGAVTFNAHTLPFISTYTNIVN